MPAKWDDNLNVKLLSNVIKIIDGHVSGEQWTKIAEIMGEDFSPKACRLQLAKIQKMTGADDIEMPAASDAAAALSPAATPRKRKAKGEAATPKKAKAAPAAPVQQEEEESIFSEFTTAYQPTPSTD